ncbi:MAG: signal peptide peptidase SppA [Holophagales bacterium]|jgi:protease-4|nr:signal peptide peptidase SppA [Holophagales bacterium]
MKSFFQSFLGAILALVIFTGGLFVFLLIMASAMGPKPPSAPNKAVLIFDLERNLPDKPTESSALDAMQNAIQGNMGQDVPLTSLIKAIDRASDDPKISGMYITGNLNSAGPAALTELKQALRRFTAKKPVISYNMGYSTRDMYLCAGLGQVILNPFGVVQLTAPSATSPFFAKAFDKYGIQVQVTRVGKFKSAVEPFTSDKMSPENREQTRGYLDEIWNGYKTELAKGRDLAADAIQNIADKKGILVAAEAVEEKMVDQLAHFDEVLGELKKMAGKDVDSKDFPQIDIDAYAKIPASPQKSRNRIAVVVAEGEIVDGEGGPGEIGGDSLARELRALRMDKNVKAVVVRVNSPGGSATASDVIQRELVALKQDRPVVVSMGNLAASGGYWISTHASHIFAEPSTITGSIGVFGMLPNAMKFANDHGITFDTVRTADFSAPSLFRPMTEKDLARIQVLVDSVYDSFINKVSEGRKLEPDKVREIAQGRVWAGAKALELGLVDEMGGLDAAIRKAAELAKIEGDYRIDAPDAPKSPLERLLKAFGGSEKRKLAKAGRFEAARNELESALRSLRSMNDPNGVYALAPVAVVN